VSNFTKANNVTNTQSLNIIGAGLAGSLLALFLSRRGYHVNVYERSKDLRVTDMDQGRSINLALAHRGIRALKAAGVFQDVEPLLIPMGGRQLHQEDGSEAYQPYGAKPEEVIYSVSRAELNKRLMTAAEKTNNVNFHFEYECLGMNTDDDFTEQPQVKLKSLQDDSLFFLDAKYIFATDGAGSRIRRALVTQGILSNQSTLLDHDYKELTIPAAHDGTHQIKKEALHIWPRGQYMLIALPNTDGSFTLTLFMPKDGPTSFTALNTKENVEEFFQQHFPSALQYLPNLSEEFFETPQGILGTVYTNPYHWEDNVLLVGDSSHAIVPFHGQGMNSAFEDCLLINELISQHDDDWTTVFRQFSLQRKANADAIATMALENYITMRDSVRHPDFHLRKQISFELERQFPNYYLPRYSMVSFHHIPYAECLRRGKINDSILVELSQNIETVSQLDLEKAEKLIKEKLPELNQDFLSY